MPANACVEVEVTAIMNISSILGLLATVLVLIYLFYALLRPEKF